MKKTLSVLLLFMLLGSLSFLAYNVLSKINHKKIVEMQIKKIPDFAYYSIAGELFTNKNLKENTPLVFLYFNTECEHCKNEITEIQKNIQKFKNLQLVLISLEQPKKILDFANNYRLNQYENINFLSDSKATFAAKFDIVSVPTVVLYGKDKQLIEKIKGEVNIEKILKKIK